MRKKIFLSTSAAALIASFAVVQAQSPQSGSGAGSPSPSATQPGSGSGSGAAGSPSGSSAQRPSESGSGSGTTQRQGGTAEGQRDNTQRQGQTTTPDRQGSQTERTGQSGQRDSANTGATSGNVSVSQEQRTQIKQRLGSVSHARVDNVNFSLSVGTVVPRGVRVYDLPPEIVSIVPRFRGYKFIVVRDEIIIVEPDTMKIVYVIES
jgi:hypothetical protein